MMQKKMINQHRCPICTLILPCKHYTSEDQIVLPEIIKPEKKIRKPSPEKMEEKPIQIKKHKPNKSALPEISLDHSDFRSQHYMTPMNQK